MVENEKNSAEFGAKTPVNQVPIRGDDDDVLPAEMRSKVVMSPTEIWDGIAVVKFFKESLSMDEEEYSVNIHRLLRFWRRFMKLRK